MVRILLSQLLTERRWSQAKLARITGIRPNTICDLYNETAAQVRLGRVDLVCEALECDISDLFALEPDETTPSQGKQ